MSTIKKSKSRTKTKIDKDDNYEVRKQLDLERAKKVDKKLILKIHVNYDDDIQIEFDRKKLTDVLNKDNMVLDLNEDYLAVKFFKYSYSEFIESMRNEIFPDAKALSETRKLELAEIDKELIEGNEKGLIKFIKKYGPDALYDEPIIEHIWSVIRKIKDENTTKEEIKMCKAALKRTIWTPLADFRGTAKRKIPGKDFEIDSFMSFREYLYKEAKEAAKHLNDSCRNGCGGSFFKSKKREGCNEMHEEFNELIPNNKISIRKKIFFKCKGSYDYAEKFMCEFYLIAPTTYRKFLKEFKDKKN
jgi:hypothetical protein